MIPFRWDDPVLQKIDRLAIFMGTEGAGLGAKTIAGLRPSRAHSDGARGRFAQRGRGERRRLLAAVPAREQRVPLPAGFVSLGRYSAPRSDSGCFGRRQSVLSWFWLWF